MSSGSMRVNGYRPEVRTSYHSPLIVGGQLVDATWRPIQYQDRKVGVGIPAGYFDQKTAEHGLLGLAAAEAIRWWFVAMAEAEGAAGSMGLETRLQEYRLETTFKVEATVAVRALNSRGKPLESGGEA